MAIFYKSIKIGRRILSKSGIVKSFEESSPAVIKLYGEHAVVKGGTSAGMPLSILAYAECKLNGNPSLRVDLLDFNESMAFSGEELKGIYSDYSKMEINGFISKYESLGIAGTMLAYATIASRLDSLEIPVIGRTVSVRSDIPMQKGLGSSAACNSAFTKALISASGKELGDEVVVDIIRDGERIVHKNKNAGIIDANTTYYSSLITVKGNSVNIIRADLSRLKILLIDTGPKLPTHVTVKRFGEFCEKDKRAPEVLKNIEKCVIEGVKALQNGDFALAGQYMYLDQEMLKMSGVSSEGLDKAVEIARENGALGAKLSGGGGGGIAIAILPDDAHKADKIKSSLAGAGFKVFESKPYIKEEKNKK